MGEPMTDLILFLDIHSGAITAISTTILAIITLGYVILTNSISKTTERNAEIAVANNMATIELTIMRDYARPEILAAMQSLRDFKKCGKYNNTIESRQKMNLDFIALQQSSPGFFYPLNGCRRIVSQFPVSNHKRAHI